MLILLLNREFIHLVLAEPNAKHRAAKKKYWLFYDEWCHSAEQEINALKSKHPQWHTGNRLYRANSQDIVGQGLGPC